MGAVSAQFGDIKQLKFCVEKPAELSGGVSVDTAVSDLVYDQHRRAFVKRKLVPAAEVLGRMGVGSQPQLHLPERILEGKLG